MSRSIRTVLRFNFKLLNNGFVNYGDRNGIRLLYSASSFGMDKYTDMRSTIQKQFASIEDTFRMKIRKLVDDNTSEMILTEDMKLMLHLANNTPEDMELLVKMIKKFNVQDKRLQFNNFAFGPVAMRTFYYLNEPDVALSTYTDPELKGFFDYLIPHQILMDLLYNNQRYEDVKMVFDILKTTFNERTGNHPKITLTLVLTACYKQNTAESLQYALEIINEYRKKNAVIPRRAILNVVALALKQNLPEVALETISMVQHQEYDLVQCVKAGIYADLNKLNNVLISLNTSRYDELQWVKNAYFTDMMEKIENAIARTDSSEATEIANLIRKIKSYSHELPNRTLDDYLSSTIVWKQRSIDEQDQRNNPFALKMRNKI